MEALATDMDTGMEALAEALDLDLAMDMAWK
jgi:hypothetical protein